MSEANLLSYLHSLPDNQPGIALDVGANIGHYTGLMALKFEHVYAFEPNPVNMAELQKNVIQTNVTFVPEAIGVTDNMMIRLYLANSPGMHTINEPVALTQKWGHKPDHFLMVPSVTFDKFAESHNNIKFIKCDVESCEDFIFETGRKMLTSNKLTLLLEVHQTVDYKRLYNLFRECGYIICNDENRMTDRMEADHHYIITNEV